MKPFGMPFARKIWPISIRSVLINSDGASPPIQIKITFEPNPLKSRTLLRRLAVKQLIQNTAKVSYHKFNSHNFNLKVSNPMSKNNESNVNRSNTLLRKCTHAKGSTPHH